MVCVKRGTVIEADKSIHSQLRLVNFSEGSPYETLHAFISKTMAPYFKSYVKESGRADRSVCMLYSETEYILCIDQHVIIFQ
jgi:hypothetical protein